MTSLALFENHVEELLLNRKIKIYNSTISDIANKLNITLIFTYSNSKVIKDNYTNNIIVLLDPELDYREQRLVFFHELTHILLEHLSICEDLNNFELKYLEKKTNDFSLALALPKHELVPLITETKKDPLELIFEISDLYEISYELVEKRMIQIKK